MRSPSFLVLCLCVTTNAEFPSNLKEDVHKILSYIRTWQTEFLTSKDPVIQSRPFVLVSFAQSLDGQIAPWANRDAAKETTCNYPLSSPESMLLTHAIRAIHDGILIGGRTLSIDNPRLNNRLWNNETGHQPIPVVLDTHLHHVPKVGSCLRAQNLVVCCGESAAKKLLAGSLSPFVSLLICNVQRNRLDLLDLLQKLRTTFGIRTLMVEGGSSILTSLFQQGLVDAVCITIAPKALCGGISPTMGLRPIDLGLLSPLFIPLGSDCIFLSRWPTNTEPTTSN
jgi:riboflavin-specific deaminase-like protein